MTIDVVSSAGPRPVTSSGQEGKAVASANVVALRRNTAPEASSPAALEIAQAEAERQALAGRQASAEGADEVRSQVEELNSLTYSIRRSLQFQVDEDTGTTVITVKDTASGEVIRQIPSEELLALSRRMRDISEQMNDVKGVLLSAEA